MVELRITPQPSLEVRIPKRARVGAFPLIPDRRAKRCADLDTDHPDPADQRPPK